MKIIGNQFNISDRLINKENSNKFGAEEQLSGKIKVCRKEKEKEDPFVKLGEAGLKIIKLNGIY